MLLGCYRRSDALDPDTYVLAVAAVLAGYSEAIIRDVTDPRRGISTHEKFQAFPPNSGELKAYCEAHAQREQRMAQYATAAPVRAAVRLPAPDPATRPQGWLANLKVPQNVDGYQAMVERSKAANRSDWCWYESGIKVPIAWWNGRKIIDWRQPKCPDFSREAAE